MKRLIDENNAPGTPEHTLARMMGGAQAYRPAPYRKARVRALIAPIQRRQRFVLRSFRGGFAMVVALGGVAAAASAIESRRFARVDPVPSPSIEAAKSPKAERTSPTGPATDPPGKLPEALSSQGDPALHAAQRSGSAEVRPHPRRNGDDPSLVLEAIRALRRQSNPARASVLLDEYLAAHPTGASAEDALALSIEAADARHDDRAAAEHGQRYLRQFPMGRFRGLAQEAVDRAVR